MLYITYMSHLQFIKINTNSRLIALLVITHKIFDIVIHFGIMTKYVAELLSIYTHLKIYYFYIIITIIYC